MLAELNRFDNPHPVRWGGDKGPEEPFGAFVVGAMLHKFPYRKAATFERRH